MYGADSVQIQHMPLLEQFDSTILIGNVCFFEKKKNWKILNLCFRIK